MEPPIGYFGSKVRVAPRIVDLLPTHEGYVEPYCGSLTVLLAKPATGFEVVNDLDGDLMLFWRILRDRPEDLERVCALTPHSRAEYQASWPIPGDVTDELERARRVWVKLTQGRGGALRSTGWRFQTTAESRTSTMPKSLRSFGERIPAAAQRLSQVTLECRPALEVIDRYGSAPSTLLYVDPPYLAETRGFAAYRLEMRGEERHRELAAALADCRSAVVISGYPSGLYDTDLYAGWHRAELVSGTGQCVGKGYQERTEVLWSNRPLRREAMLWEVTG